MRNTEKHSIKYLLKKALAVVLSVMLTTGLLADMDSVKAAAADGGVTPSWAGSGTETDPWIIENNEQLQQFAAAVNAGETYRWKYFKISDDAENLFLDTPIGVGSYAMLDTMFWGTFDGNGKTIELAIEKDSDEWCGLFGGVFGAHIKNIRVTGYVKGMDVTGGIVGSAGDNSIIENCVNEAEITAWKEDGDPLSIAGGIVGMNHWVPGDVIVQNCYNTGKVTGQTAAGGIVGCGNVKVYNCYNTGDVINEQSNAAGIVGDMYTDININCYHATVCDCVSLSLKVSQLTASERYPENTRRVISAAVSEISFSNNQARSDMKIGLAGGETEVPADNPEVGNNKKHGADIAVDGSLKTTDVFASWDPDIWEIPEGDFEPGCKLPTLKAVSVSNEDWPLLPGEHEHKFEWQHDEKEHWKKCDCGVTTDKEGHTMAVEVTEPTETTAGEKVSTCTVCGYKETETLPPLDNRPETPDISGNNPNPENPDISGNNPKPENPNIGGNEPNPENPDIGGNEPNPENPNIGGNEPKPETPDIGGNEPNPENPDIGGNEPNPENPDNGGSEPNPETPDGDGSDDNAVNMEKVNVVETGGNSVNGSAGREPKTGDVSHTEYWITLAMIAGFGYLLCLFMDQTGGMTEKEKNEKVAALIAWAKCGGRMRRYVALAVIFLLLTYYHSIGKQREVDLQKRYPVL